MRSNRVPKKVWRGFGDKVPEGYGAKPGQIREKFLGGFGAAKKVLEDLVMQSRVKFNRASGKVSRL